MTPKNWTFFLEHDAENTIQRTGRFLNMTQWIEPFFWLLLQRIEPFSTWLKELDLFYMTWRIEPLFLECDSKNWTFFVYDSKELNLFFYYDSKNLTFSGMWLKECFFFFWNVTKKWSFFLHDSKNWTFFFHDSKNWTLLFECDSKNWTLFCWMWPKEFFWKICLKELNPFFSLNMT